jgi:hypothetical protein
MLQLCIMDGRAYSVLEEGGRQNIEEFVEECVILANNQVNIHACRFASSELGLLQTLAAVVRLCPGVVHACTHVGVLSLTLWALKTTWSLLDAQGKPLLAPGRAGMHTDMGKVAVQMQGTRAYLPDLSVTGTASAPRCSHKWHCACAAASLGSCSLQCRFERVVPRT